VGGCILDICEKISRRLGVSMTQARLEVIDGCAVCRYCGVSLGTIEVTNGKRYVSLVAIAHYNNQECEVIWNVNQAVEDYKTERMFDPTAGE